VQHAASENKQPSDGTSGEQKLCNARESAKPAATLFFNFLFLTLKKENEAFSKIRN
jgi:hypothetical protein